MRKPKIGDQEEVPPTPRFSAGWRLISELLPPPRAAVIVIRWSGPDKKWIVGVREVDHSDMGVWLYWAHGPELDEPVMVD